ncbi:SUKH-3 domain-containing protein [Streptomyces sp. NPDC057257]|uniref:SUKH-3 domain-containing protein n=1 Tax=Streptomyces sp. NPDC057257 TaxID=3346071 RepID=UPI0036334530
MGRGSAPLLRGRHGGGRARDRAGDAGHGGFVGGRGWALGDLLWCGHTLFSPGSSAGTIASCSELGAGPVLSEWSPDALEVLEASGWTAGRRVDTTGWRSMFEAVGIVMHDAAERFLREFAGLNGPSAPNACQVTDAQRWLGPPVSRCLR